MEGISIIFLDRFGSRMDAVFDALTEAWMGETDLGHLGILRVIYIYIIIGHNMIAIAKNIGEYGPV